MNSLLQNTTTDLENVTFTALKDFADGYRWMFDKLFECTQDSSMSVPAGEVNKLVEGITATSTISYTCKDGGEGEIKVVLDKNALFTLGGTTVMFPVMRIKEDRIRGTEEDAKNLADAIGEVGNLLKGSFSKQFHAATTDVDGFNNELDMRLCMPGSMVEKDMKVNEEIGEYHVFTYQFTCTDFDPYIIRVIFPVS